MVLMRSGGGSAVSLRATVDAWVEVNSAQAEVEELSLSVSESTAADLRSVTVDLDGPMRLGSSTLWESGLAELQMGSVRDRQVISESLSWVSSADVVRWCDRLLAAIRRSDR